MSDKAINILLGIIVIGLVGWFFMKGSNDASPSVSAESFNASGAAVTAVSGSDLQRVETRNDKGELAESGFLKGELKTGTWLTYHPEGRPKSIATYAGGKLNGLYMELNNRGQVELESFYVDGLLNGNYTAYRSGSRITEERQYKMGKLDGVFKKYDDRKNNLQQEIHYKNGLQDGPYRFYDEEGNITMEYQYKDGNKVSGGIVEKAAGE